MSELEQLTVRQVIEVLRERVERNRDIEETARQERERDEAALTAFMQLVGIEAPVAPEPTGTTPVRLGIAAVREVMREAPTKIWTPREIHAVLEERGWLSGEAKHPRAGTESAVNRLLAKGEITRVGRGKYRWRTGQEALAET